VAHPLSCLPAWDFQEVGACFDAALQCQVLTFIILRAVVILENRNLNPVIRPVWETRTLPRHRLCTAAAFSGDVCSIQKFSRIAMFVSFARLV
jgi:hypothetical protein